MASTKSHGAASRSSTTGWRNEAAPTFANKTEFDEMPQATVVGGIACDKPTSGQVETVGHQLLSNRVGVLHPTEGVNGDRGAPHAGERR